METATKKIVGIANYKNDEMNDDSFAASSSSCSLLTSSEDEEILENTKIEWEKLYKKPEGSNLLEDISMNFHEPEFEYIQNIVNIPVNITKTSLPIDFFLLFFPVEFFDEIVFQTNLYASQIIGGLKQKNLLKTSSRMHSWKPVIRSDIFNYIGLILWTGILSNDEMEGII